MYFGCDLSYKTPIPIERFLPHIFSTSIDGKYDYRHDVDNAPPELLTILNDMPKDVCTFQVGGYASPANPDLARSLIMDSRYQELKKDYATVQNNNSSETHTAFAALANYVVDKAAQLRLGARYTDPKNVKRRITFVRTNFEESMTNDDERVTKALPDLFALRESVRLREKNGQIHDRATAEGQDCCPLEWWDVLLFVEIVHEPSEAENVNSEAHMMIDLQSNGLGLPVALLPQSEPKTPSSVREKCEEYALRAFAEGGTRPFFFGFLVLGGTLQLMSYQRSGVILTHPFNFLDEDHKFIAVLEGLEKLCDRRCGRGEMLIPMHGNDLDLDEDDEHDWQRLMGASLYLYTNAGLQGEWTKIRYMAPIGFEYPRSSLIFDGWVEVNAPPSWEQIISSNGNRVFVKVGTEQLTKPGEVKMIDSARRIAKQSRKQNWTLSRLPRLLYHSAYQEFDEHAIRSQFAVMDPDPISEIRGLRVTAFESLFLVSLISSPLELLQVYTDFVEGHKFLVQYCRIVHRKIMPEKLAYRIETERGIARKCGVIFDFESAVIIGDHSVPILPRTGESGFMSCDLLNPAYDIMPHYPRHDLESIFYCLLHHITKYELDPQTNGTRAIAIGEYDHWFGISRSKLHSVRESFWTSFNGTFTSTSHFVPVLKMTIMRLQGLIRDGKDAFHRYLAIRRFYHAYGCFPNESDAEDPMITELFNIKTLGDYLTHDNMLNIMKNELAYARKLAGMVPVARGKLEATFSKNNRWEDLSTEDVEVLQALVEHNGFVKKKL